MMQWLEDLNDTSLLVEVDVEVEYLGPADDTLSTADHEVEHPAGAVGHLGRAEDGRDGGDELLPAEVVERLVDVGLVVVPAVCRAVSPLSGQK